MPLALEVIATSVEDAVRAEEGGASRIELVRELDRGGMTPPLSLVDAVLAAVAIPVRVMVRETEAHEVRAPAVRRRLVEQAHAIGQRNVDGLVFGALEEGRIDVALLDAVAGAAGRTLTFHRAFEAAADPQKALATLTRHPAVDRILCDGGDGNWPARAARLADWSRRAAGRLRLLPGGGITDEAVDVLSRTPEILELHVGRLVRDPATTEGVVSTERVAALVHRLRLLRPR
jgi:copper homeostasis protein